MTTSPGWDASPSLDTQHKAARSITTPSGLDNSPSRVPSMERLGVLLLPIGWDASPSEGTQHWSITIPPLDWVAVHHSLHSMKQLGVLLLPRDEMQFYHRIPIFKPLRVRITTPPPPVWNDGPSQGSPDLC